MLALAREIEAVAVPAAAFAIAAHGHRPSVMANVSMTPIATPATRIVKTSRISDRTEAEPLSVGIDPLIRSAGRTWSLGVGAPGTARKLGRSAS